MITSITMTLFYLLMYFIFEIRYQRKNIVLRIVMIALATLRIALCLLPAGGFVGRPSSNDWNAHDAKNLYVYLDCIDGSQSFKIIIRKNFIGELNGKLQA